jgi:hypothetical protein
MTTPTPEEYAALVRRIEQALNEHPQFNDAQVRVLRLKNYPDCGGD